MGAKKVADKPWTRKEELRLEELRLSGMTATEIAVAMDRSLHSVKGRLQRLGVNRVSRSLAWLGLFAAGLTDAEAAHEMGVCDSTPRTARTRLRKAGYDLADRRSLRHRRS